MLERKENPVLFDMLLYAYTKAINLEDGYYTKILQDEQLEKITELSIYLDKFSSLDSLKGIEKCKNLKNFTCYTIDEAQYNITLDDKNKTYEQFYKENQEKTNLNIFQDISPLYECKKLEEIYIENQKNITELDLSNWPNLKILDALQCYNLKHITGLDTFIKNLNLNEKHFLYLTGCPKIEQIDYFLETIEYLKQNKIEDKNLNINLDALSYYKLCKSYKNHQLEKSLLNYAQLQNCENSILWGENFYGNDPDYILYNSEKMYLNKLYMDEIIQKEVTEQNCLNDFEKIHNIYKWIIFNIDYDYEYLSKEETMPYEERNQSPISSTMRSSMRTLWQKKGVCVGYASILANFLCDMGYDAKNTLVFQGSNKNDIINEGFNHSITKLDYNGDTYFFDPTAKSHDYFFLNKQELIDKDYLLNYKDFEIKNAPSKQNEIYDYLHNDTLIKQIKKTIIKTKRNLKINHFLGKSEKPIFLTTEQKSYAKNKIDEITKERTFIDDTFNTNINR